MPREFYSGKELVTHRWFLLTVPGEIKIEDYFSDIRVTHEKRTNWWKGGLVSSIYCGEQGLYYVY